MGVIFLHAELDDYGLTAAEFRLYAHMARRAGSGEARSSIPTMAAHCKIAEKCVRRDLKVLIALNLIGVIQKRAGKPTIYGLLHKNQWASPEKVEELREKAIAAGKTRTKATTTKPQPQEAKEKEAIAPAILAECAIAKQTPPLPENPYPLGDWIVDGELDKNFIQWIAAQYSKEYGHSPYKAEENVKRSFINNPAKLKPAWERYHKEMAHLMLNLKVQEEQGINVENDKQFLEKHQRAILSQSLKETDYFHSQFLIDVLQSEQMEGDCDRLPDSNLSIEIDSTNSSELPKKSDSVVTKKQIKLAFIAQASHNQNSEFLFLKNKLEDPVFLKDPVIQGRCKKLLESGDYEAVFDKFGFVLRISEIPF